MGFKEWIAKLDAMTPEERLATITLDEVRFYDDAIVLSWSGVIGFGQYRIELTREFETDKHGYQQTTSYAMQASSEGMDLHNDNKKFLRHLLNQFVEKVSLADEQERHANWEERQKNKGVTTDE